MSTQPFIPSGLGWHRDSTDPRDLTPVDASIVEMFASLPPAGSLPNSVDWRTYCDGTGNQLSLNASTAFACLELLKYFERRAFGRVVEFSQMFAYVTARRLLNWSGNSGAKLRTTWKAITRLGVPAERNWPYEVCTVDKEPDSFAYGIAEDFSALRYIRLDRRGLPGTDTLQTAKSFLAAGFPSVFGFPVFTSVTSAPEIPYPTSYDRLRGGQAVMALGYDDELRVRSDKGALLIRNSWGERWGDQGHGWLPYSYVEDQLASDFWTVCKVDWLDSEEFLRPV